MSRASSRSPRQTFRGDLLRGLRIAIGNMPLEYIAEKLKVTRGTVSRWENDLVQPEQKHVSGLCGIFTLSSDYFYDGNEQRPIPASIVAGNIATFTQAAPILDKAQNRIVVFQTGAPKAPLWWREKVRTILNGNKMEYLVIACIPKSQVSLNLRDAIDASIKEYEFINLKILPEDPQLCFDVMLVDDRHIFVAIHAYDFITRECGIYFEDKRAGEVLNRWLLEVSGKAIPYPLWRSRISAEIHAFGSFHRPP
jgi:transcriptional regulator with XRE-family HTH domain